MRVKREWTMEITCGILSQHHLKKNKVTKERKKKRVKSNHIIKEINKDANNLVKGHLKSVHIKSH